MKICDLKEPLKTWVEELICEKVFKDKKEELVMEWVEANYKKRSRGYSYNVV